MKRLTERENFFAMLQGNAEYVSCYTVYNKIYPLQGDLEMAPGGKDKYGVEWSVTPDGIIPKPGFVMFEEASDWPEYIDFRKLSRVDYHVTAEKEITAPDADKVRMISIYGFFMRLVSLMGFENALMALACEPEACLEFGMAWADYQIERIDRILDAYDLDVISYSDDVATERSLFMSPNTYSTVIRPVFKRIIDATLERGMLFSYHCCGKCADVIEDAVNMGVRIWNSAQIMNDLEGIQKKYGPKLIVEGGWNSSGPPSYVNATEEEVLQELDRCLHTYGKYGNYVLFPIIMSNRGNALIVGDPRLDALKRRLSEINDLSDLITP